MRTQHERTRVLLGRRDEEMVLVGATGIVIVGDRKCRQSLDGADDRYGDR
jgi:hypothetical protein